MVSPAALCAAHRPAGRVFPSLRLLSARTPCRLPEWSRPPFCGPVRRACDIPREWSRYDCIGISTYAHIDMVVHCPVPTNEKPRLWPAGAPGDLRAGQARVTSEIAARKNTRNLRRDQPLGCAPACQVANLDVGAMD